MGQCLRQMQFMLGCSGDLVSRPVKGGSGAQYRGYMIRGYRVDLLSQLSFQVAAGFGVGASAANLSGFQGL